MANNQYCTAINWGKGFITANDSRKIGFSSYPGDIWKVPVNNQDANRWITGVNGARKTLEEAQAIVDAKITQLQADYDAIPDDDPRKDPDHPAGHVTRAVDITLEE